MFATSDMQESRLLVSKEVLLEPLKMLPPVEFAFAYGSGVFQQPTTSSSSSSSSSSSQRPMVDYILGVSSPRDWHSQNIEMNPHHYSSWLAHFGGKVVADAADIVGVGVHFNPFVPWKDKTVIKYGVISLPNLVDDIFNWKRLYISGRLQKPVCILIDYAGLEKANQVNLQSALSTALLLLQSKFSEAQLYNTICGLSYTGDVRVNFAEDRNKVKKIVQGNFLELRNLYKGAIYQAAGIGVLQLPISLDKEGYQFSIPQDPNAVNSLVTSLPTTLLQFLAVQARSEPSGESVAEAMMVNNGRDRAKLVRKAVGSIVRTSSLRQTVSGIIAAGGVNAVRYVSRKICKAVNSL